jgi:hypothetical protein
MYIYEILPALDLTQSVHAKISIGMQRLVKFKISRIPLIGLETRLGWRTDRKFLRNPNLNEIIVTLLEITDRILDISEPGHLGTDLDISVLGSGHFCTDLDISVLGTGQFGTWMRQYSLLTTNVWYLLIVNIFVQIVL